MRNNGKLLVSRSFAIEAAIVVARATFVSQMVGRKRNKKRCFNGLMQKSENVYCCWSLVQLVVTWFPACRQDGEREREREIRRRRRRATCSTGFAAMLRKWTEEVRKKGDD